MNRQFSSRFAALFAVLVIVLSACSVSNDTASISIPGRQGPVISPFITGLWSSETAGHPDQLSAYLKWFRGSGNDTPPPASGAILDPSCPLEYDYQRMATIGGWGNSDALAISEVRGEAGFYNPARLEVLFLLRGHTFNTSNGSNRHCDPVRDADLEAYVPVRVNLGTGLWQVDGWASPASTIVVTAAQGFPMVPVKSDHEIAGDHSIISPFRLARFQITPENFDRVVRYATLNDDRQGYSRKIVWFRQSDVSPSYAHLASGTNCRAGYFAFWSSNGDDLGGKLAPPGCKAKALDTSDRNLTSYLDRMTRMVGQDRVWDTSEDDTCTAFSGSSCDRIDNDSWKVIAADLTALVNGKADYRSAIAKLKADLTGYDKNHGTNLVTNFAPPDEFGGWDNTDSGLFAIIAAGGKRAMDDTKDAIANGTANQGLVGFVGSPVGTDASGSLNTVTISPSFSYAEVKTDSAASAFYDKYSLILNDNQRAFNVMAFSTSGSGAAGAKLPYDQSPLAQLTIRVSDTLNAANTNTYTSNWIPMFASGRNAGALSVRKNFDLLGDFGGAVSQAVSDLLYGIYRATVGGWLSGLAQAATSNLLSVPTLDPYQVSYQRPDGSAVYILNSELVRFDVAIRNIISGKDVTFGLKGDEAICTAAAWSGKLSNPENVITSGGKSFSVSSCFQQNTTYALFNIVRGFSLFLVIVLIGRYFLAIMSGSEKRKFGLTAFFARCIFVFAFILGMDTVLRVMGTIVAETVLVTNLVGTQAGGGTPYSHLWLFSAYLNSPSRDLNIFAMILMSPFLLLGLFVLFISNLLRYAMTYFVVGVSPLWVISLLNSARPAFFYRSLLWLIRLYLIPLLALVVVLVLFIVARTLGISATNAGLVEAVIGMVMLIAVAVLPAILAKTIINMAAQPFRAAIDGALSQVEGHKSNVALEAIAGTSSEASAKAAQDARMGAFRPEMPSGMGAGGAPGSWAPGGGVPGLAPVAGADMGPGSARLGAGGYGGVAPAAAGGWGVPPAAGAPGSWSPPGGWSPGGGIPGLAAGIGGPIPGIASPPPPAPSPGGGFETNMAPPAGAPDLSRGSLRLRLLRSARDRGLAQVKDLTGAAQFISETRDQRTEDQIAKYGPLAPAFKDGKAILGADGAPVMTPGGRPPSDRHDRIVTGLSYLTGTAIVSSGFEADSRTGRALSYLDQRTRAVESIASSGKQQLNSARHGDPEANIAFSEHAASLGALKSQAEALDTPRRALTSALSRSTDPANDPAVAGARRALNDAQNSLLDQQRTTRSAWDRLANLEYKAPLVGDGRHIARDQIAFEQARNAALTSLVEANEAVTRSFGRDAAALSSLSGLHGPVVAPLADRARSEISNAQREQSDLTRVAAERHERTLLLQHDYQSAPERTGRTPALRLLRPRTS